MKFLKRFALSAMLCLPMQSCSADGGQEESKVFHATIDRRYAAEVAVQDPDGRFIYIRLMELACQGASYRNGELIIIPEESIGVEWRDGVPIAINTFREAGDYKIYASDNLETELENSFATTYPIHYQPAKASRNGGDEAGCVLNGSAVDRGHP